MHATTVNKNQEPPKNLRQKEGGMLRPQQVIEFLFKFNLIKFSQFSLF